MIYPFLFYDGHNVIRTKYNYDQINDSFLYLAGIVMLNHKPDEYSRIDLNNLEILFRSEYYFKASDGNNYNYEDIVFSLRSTSNHTNIKDLQEDLKQSQFYNDFLYGISIIAFRYGYSCGEVTPQSKPDIIPEEFDNALFKIVKQNRKEVALEAKNQLSLFQSVLDENPTLLTGGTGIGKTRFIPLLVYYFSYLIETTIHTFNRSYKTKNVVVAMPRTILISGPVDNMLCMMGFNSSLEQPEDNYSYVKINSMLRYVENKVTVLPATREGTFIVPKYQIVDTETPVKSDRCIECNAIKRRFKKVIGSLCNTCFNTNTNPIKPTMYIGTSQSLIPYVNIQTCRSVIIDEFHEHDTWSDLVYAKSRQESIKHLFMITATPESDIDRLRMIHKDLLRIHIPGIAFPITSHICTQGGFDLFKLGVTPNFEQSSYKKFEQIQIINLLNILVLKLKSNEAIIIFFTAKLECDKFANLCRQNFSSDIFVGSMYAESELSKTYQSVLKGKKSIIAATNVLESSITINEATYVIDCGRQILVCNNEPSEVYISKPQQLQRRGRVGRVKPGTYYSMFDPNLLPRSSPAKIDYEDISVMVASMVYSNIDRYSLFYEMTNSRIIKIDSVLNKLRLNKIIINNTISDDLYLVFCRHSDKPLEVLKFAMESKNILNLLESNSKDARVLKRLIRSIPLELRNTYPYKIGTVINVNDKFLTFELGGKENTFEYQKVDMSRLTRGSKLRFFDNRVFRELTIL